MNKSPEWKLVPVEPTEDMREAFHEATERYEDGHGESPDSQWRAMLRAAPHPPVVEEKDVARDDYKTWYEEAMAASNAAGFAGMSAAQVIDCQDKEIMRLRTALVPGQTRDDVSRDAEHLDEREAFEEWMHTYDFPPNLAGEVFSNPRYPALCGQFVYDERETQRCWAAWQARAGLGSQRPASV